MSTEQLPFPLVQATWKKAMALPEDKGFGRNFYKNLFAKHPGLLETLFKGVSIANQEKNLPKSITTVLGLLTDMPKAVEALQALGARHVLYGTPDQGYAVVGSNVIETLAQILGDDFTAEAKAEWIAIYAVIEKTMIDATKLPSAAPWWQRFYAKRAKELQGLLASANGNGASSAAISKQVGSKADLAAIASAIAENKQIAGPAATFSQGMSADNVKNLGANLTAAFEKQGKLALNPYDKMVIDWFVAAVQENAVEDLPFPLVQATWKKAMALPEDKGFGRNFYKNLFAKHPGLLETLFKGVSIANQEKNLPKSITTVLGLLTDMPKAVEALQALGQRHVLYATPEAGYRIVGGNVIDTLAQILGDEFTPEAKAEWIAIYAVIEKTMIDATKLPSAAPWWQRFYAKRAKELQGLLASANGNGASSAAISKQVGSKADLAAIASAIAENKQIAGPAATFSQGMSADNVKNLGANLTAAFEKQGKLALNPYDKMVIDWFVAAVQENASSAASSSSCCGSSTTSFVVGGAVVAAIAAGAWFFLKNKK